MWLHRDAALIIVSFKGLDLARPVDVARGEKLPRSVGVHTGIFEMHVAHKVTAGDVAIRPGSVSVNQGIGWIPV